MSAIGTRDRLIGLARRAGRLVIGTNGVRAALQRSEVAAVVVAADRSRRTEAKVQRLAEARGVPVISGPPADTLGRLLGRSTVQVVGVTDEHLASGMLAGEARSPAGGTSGY